MLQAEVRPKYLVLQSQSLIAPSRLIAIIIAVTVTIAMRIAVTSTDCNLYCRFHIDCNHLQSYYTHLWLQVTSKSRLRLLRT